MTTNPYQQYRTQGVMTANPVTLVVMLYDGCIKQMQLAQLALQSRNLEVVNRTLTRAQDIINELDLTLDHTYEISADLSKMYAYLRGALIDANVKKDGEVLPDLIEMVAELREAWAAIAKDYIAPPSDLDF